ncbi:vesicle-associated membrane protein-associated protein-like protein C16G5.05c [Lipomyces tetrasporus]|uniref:Vesicle-associated membrane protein-associated protein-like protein C16G5.05c n=1 Tax=Lipomyces tetrasporus TaxID=54092 RepID=A0AAD7QLJ7_9ASCO|nr:vesicle-associated membrane protein-associated protein-like protein C16G5.05c [Lipomyces tetrasporus]KAJ8097423.1 vesicle-associated membrane protein-associated protein-like protein C16G5.05c [Lipomyces tetrasporus]
MEISPSVLEFSGPFMRTITRTLQLHNKTPEPMAYKVKTTAPKLYCVRPNASRVNPGETIDVQIILQGLKQEPAPDYKCKDKFLVQSVPIAPEQETLSVGDLWSAVEKSSKEKISDYKIRVHYQIPQSQSEPLTPTAAAAPAGAAFATPTSNGTKSVPGSVEKTLTESLENAPTVVSSSSEGTEKLQETIKKLESELEKAKEASPTLSGTTTAVRSGNQGVPIPMAALLCLIAFLLAWLFF